MTNKHKKIIYLNVVILLAFICAISLAITLLSLHLDTKEKLPEELIIGTISAPIVTGSMAFWTYELKHLFNIKTKESK